MNVGKLRKRIHDTEEELATIEQRIPQVEKIKQERLLNGEDVSAVNAEIRKLSERQHDLTTVLPKLQEKLNVKEFKIRVTEIVKEATECKGAVEKHQHKIEELRNATREEYTKYKKVRGRLVHLRAEIDKMKAEGADIPSISIPSIQNESNIDYFANNKGIFLRC